MGEGAIPPLPLFLKKIMEITKTYLESQIKELEQALQTARNNMIATDGALQYAKITLEFLNKEEEKPIEGE